MASIYFLNADIDLESKCDLTPLVAELGDNIVVMNFDKDETNKLSIELAGINGTPDSLIKEYARLIDNLTKSARELWNGCSKREIDFGFECEGEAQGVPQGLTENLSLDSINILNKLKISLAITIYAVPA